MQSAKSALCSSGCTHECSHAAPAEQLGWQGCVAHCSALLPVRTQGLPYGGTGGSEEGVCLQLLAQAAGHGGLALRMRHARELEEELPQVHGGQNELSASVAQHHMLRSPTCALSSSMRAARSTSAAFPLSTFFAKRALDCVYSCPQNIAVLGGSSRSFASDCSSTGRKGKAVLCAASKIG